MVKHHDMILATSILELMPGETLMHTECRVILWLVYQKMSPISPAISETSEAEMTAIAEICVIDRCVIAFDK